MSEIGALKLSSGSRPSHTNECLARRRRTQSSGTQSFDPPSCLAQIFIPLILGYIIIDEGLQSNCTSCMQITGGVFSKGLCKLGSITVRWLRNVIIIAAFAFYFSSFITRVLSGKTKSASSTQNYDECAPGNSHWHEEGDQEGKVDFDKKQELRQQNDDFGQEDVEITKERQVLKKREEEIQILIRELERTNNEISELINKHMDAYTCGAQGPGHKHIQQIHLNSLDIFDKLHIQSVRQFEHERVEWGKQKEEERAELQRAKDEHRRHVREFELEKESWESLKTKQQEMWTTAFDQVRRKFLRETKKIEEMRSLLAEDMEELDSLSGLSDPSHTESEGI